MSVYFLDDVWTRNNDDEKILLKLLRLADTAVISRKPRNRFLYSKRDLTLTYAHVGEHVKFSERENRGKLREIYSFIRVGRRLMKWRMRYRERHFARFLTCAVDCHSH